MTSQSIQTTEILRQAGFRVDNKTGAYRLIRMFDSSQAPKGHLGNIAETNEDDVITLGLSVVQTVLRDEAARSQLPRQNFGKEGSYIPAIG
jgi:hypothetical protein